MKYHVLAITKDDGNFDRLQLWWVSGTNWVDDEDLDRQYSEFIGNATVFYTKEYALKCKAVLEKHRLRIAGVPFHVAHIIMI